MESITRVGVDVARGWLDIEIDRPNMKRKRFSNDLRGIAELQQFLGSGRFVVALESSGRYEALLRHALQAAGHEVLVKNPRQVRQLAQGLGVQSKTDAIDAKVLAETAELGPKNEPRSKERERLGDISRTIECLKKERSRHKKRLKVPGLDEIAATAFNSIIKAIDTQIKSLEMKFVSLVKKSSLANRYELALSVEGVGPCLARIIVCELPEGLNEWSVRELSTYAGVAAIDNTSGTKKKPSRVPRHGNSHLKAGLYMPALCLIAQKAWAKKVYRRLREKGRSHQQAAIAVMHKHLIYIIAVLKRGSPWQEKPAQTT